MVEILFSIIVLIFSVVIHEVSHGAMAYSLGDSTAKDAGRLTLNPIKHLDPIGSVALPIFLVLMANFTGRGIIFGWAKPVPVNPYNFSDKKYGSAKVALAGPAANLAVALFFGLILRFFSPMLEAYGLSLMFFYIIYINILLAVFNLIPVPPLDGSHILFTFLPAGMEHIRVFLNQFGIFILLFILIYFFQFLSVIIGWIFSLITGFPLF